MPSLLPHPVHAGHSQCCPYAKQLLARPQLCPSRRCLLVCYSRQNSNAWGSRDASPAAPSAPPSLQDGLGFLSDMGRRLQAGFQPRPPGFPAGALSAPSAAFTCAVPSAAPKHWQHIHVQTASQTSWHPPAGPTGDCALQLLQNPLQFLEQTTRQYGRVVGLVLGGERVVLVADPALARRVLIDDAAHFQKAGHVAWLSLPHHCSVPVTCGLGAEGQPHKPASMIRV